MFNTKRIVGVPVTAFLLLMMVSFVPAALAQETNTAPQEDQTMTDLAVSGQLKSVDPEAKKFIVTTTEGADVEFSYDEQTEFSGGQTIEGLANSSGSQVTVYFRDDNGQKKATRIEVQATNETEGTGQETEPSPAPEPSPHPGQTEQPQLPQDPQEQPPLPNDPGTQPQEPGQVPPGA